MVHPHQFLFRRHRRIDIPDLIFSKHCRDSSKCMYGPNGSRELAPPAGKYHRIPRADIFVFFPARSGLHFFLPVLDQKKSIAVHCPNWQGICSWPHLLIISYEMNNRTAEWYNSATQGLRLFTEHSNTLCARFIIHASQESPPARFAKATARRASTRVFLRVNNKKTPCGA